MKGYPFSQRVGINFKTIYATLHKIRAIMSTIEPNEPAPECSHPNLGKPTKARFKFTACPDCGWVFDGYVGKWERTRLRVSLPVTDEKVFEGVLMCCLRSPPQTRKQIEDWDRAESKRKKANG